MMSRQHSPFAALSSREQQERWLEFQSTKLPYIRGDVENIEEEDSKLSSPPMPAQKNDRQAIPAQSFQQTHHKQYDAVIKRMTDAAKQTKSFQTASW